MKKLIISIVLALTLVGNQSVHAVGDKLSFRDWLKKQNTFGFGFFLPEAQLPKVYESQYKEYLNYLANQDTVSSSVSTTRENNPPVTSSSSAASDLPAFLSDEETDLDLQNALEQSVLEQRASSSSTAFDSPAFVSDEETDVDLQNTLEQSKLGQRAPSSSAAAAAASALSTEEREDLDLLRALANSLQSRTVASSSSYSSPGLRHEEPETEESYGICPLCNIEYLLSDSDYCRECMQMYGSDAGSTAIAPSATEDELEQLYRKDSNGNNPLHLACKAGNVRLVRELVNIIKKQSEDIRKTLMTAKNNDGLSPWEIAATLKRNDILKIAIDWAWEGVNECPICTQEKTEIIPTIWYSCLDALCDSCKKHHIGENYYEQPIHDGTEPFARQVAESRRNPGREMELPNGWFVRDGSVYLKKQKNDVTCPFCRETENLSL